MAGHVVTNQARFEIHSCFSRLQLPLQSSQPPPFSPPQLPLIGLRPFITPMAIAPMTLSITANVMITVVIKVM
jgi:hypothetical protein